MGTQVNIMADQMREELTSGILPYWLTCRDLRHGGFIGRIDGHGVRHTDADKGAVMTARILWAFSAAYRMLGSPEYLDAARAAYDFLAENLIDPEYGGVYWAVDYKGSPSQTKKQSYAAGFAIYGLSEYYRACGDETSLELAKEIYRMLERHAYDPETGGYVEALSRSWGALDDVRLSGKDANERFTMNTHLHILEPYTNLLRVWNDAGLRERVRNLAGIFADRIFDPATGHLGLFFGDGWERRGDEISYGHDIEAAWLLWEAAEVLGDAETEAKVKPISLKLADTATEGLQEDGSLTYERHPSRGFTDMDRHWWVQAEAVTGWFNAWEMTGDDKYCQRSVETWHYIKTRLRDVIDGEWWWSIRADGSVNRGNDKAGFWKCPYHNGRMCMEIMRRAKKH